MMPVSMPNRPQKTMLASYKRSEIDRCNVGADLASFFLPTPNIVRGGGDRLRERAARGYIGLRAEKILQKGVL